MAIEVFYSDDSRSIYMEPCKGMYDWPTVSVELYTHAGEVSFRVQRGFSSNLRVRDALYQAIFDMTTDTDDGDGDNGDEWEVPSDWEHEVALFLSAWDEVSHAVDLMWSAPNAEITIKMP